MFKTSKRTKTKGKMLRVSNWKLAIVAGTLHSAKREKIRQQVEKMLQEQKQCAKYQPFTSKSPKRRPRQVGAGTLN